MRGLFAAESAANMAYIHQLKNWPRFSWDTAHLAPALADVRHRQGRLLGRMESLGFDVRERASLATLTQDVVKSSAIEGEALDERAVRSSLARRLGVDIGGLERSTRDVDGIVEVMLDATQNHDATLTSERLWAWHAALFPMGRSGLRRIAVGAWRGPEAGPMQVVSGRGERQRVHFEAPAAERLDGEMARFLDWFNAPPADLDPVLRAGIAHFWFVTIHPFEDGNGRLARAIADNALARADATPLRFYSMSSRIEAERADYYRALESQQRGDLDLTPWLDWFLGCLRRALDAAEEALAGVLHKTRVWELANRGPVNERQRVVLNRLLDGFEGHLTSGKYAKLAKCSPDTAQRDIAALVERGVLVRNAGGGRSTSYRIASVG